MKICVTGGAGFIASHIVDRYVELGHEVHVVDNLSSGFVENINPKAIFHKIDINDSGILDLFKNEKFEVLNHHAAQMNVRVSVDDPKFDASINIIGSLNLYEACKETGVKKVIFASSGGTVYGDIDEIPSSETSPTEPCSPYGISKLMNEKYLFYYKQFFNLNYAVLRYGNVYGPRQNPHGEAGVVAIFIKKMLKGEQPIINGDGKITRDYVFINDVVNANTLALNDNFLGIFNIGTAREIDVNYIFNSLKKLINPDCPEIHGPAKSGEQRRSCCSFKKINELHQWSPILDFEEALIPTIEYFKSKK